MGERTGIHRTNRKVNRNKRKVNRTKRKVKRTNHKVRRTNRKFKKNKNMIRKNIIRKNTMRKNTMRKRGGVDSFNEEVIEQGIQVFIKDPVINRQFRSYINRGTSDNVVVLSIYYKNFIINLTLEVEKIEDINDGSLYQDQYTYRIYHILGKLTGNPKIKDNRGRAGERYPDSHVTIDYNDFGIVGPDEPRRDIRTLVPDTEIKIPILVNKDWPEGNTNDERFMTFFGLKKSRTRRARETIGI